MIRNALWSLWVTLICWAGRHINWDSTRGESHQEVSRSLENGRKQVSEEPNGILTWNLTGRWDPKGHESLSLQFEICSLSPNSDCMKIQYYFLTYINGTCILCLCLFVSYPCVIIAHIRKLPSFICSKNICGMPPTGQALC